MKKLKGILALGLALGIIASVGGGSVFAIRNSFGRVNGYGTTGYSYCYTSHGYSNTNYYGKSCYVSVNSIYGYVNKKTLSTGTKTGSSGGNNRTCAQVDIYAPSNCRSAYISSTHVVTSGGQSWVGSTDDTYFTV